MTRYLITHFKNEIFVLHTETQYQKNVNPENYIMQGGVYYCQVGSTYLGVNAVRERIRFGLTGEADSFSLDRGMEGKVKTDISKIILEEITKRKRLDNG